MSFKDEYNELQRQIAPDEEFIERLAEKLQNEKQVKKKKNKTRFRAVILSSAAGCAATAAALFIIANMPRPAPSPDILGVGADKIDRLDGVFISSGIEIAAVSPAELAEILENENSTVYRSDESTFDFDDKTDGEHCRELARRLENASETSSEPSGSVKYYMAVSESGNVVKFSVSDNVLTIGDKRYELC